jgi:hypothetical protein
MNQDRQPNVLLGIFLVIGSFVTVLLSWVLECFLYLFNILIWIIVVSPWLVSLYLMWWWLA